MKPIIIFILLSVICFSCKQIYDPDLEVTQKALIVEGLITNAATPYTVKLSYAVVYNKSDYKVVTQAKVNILDDFGNQYKLSETNNGTYISNPAEFVGQIGRSYTLHIETKDGDVYESTPQLLLSNNYEITTYAEFSSQDELLEDYYGEVTKVTIQGVDLLFDLKNNSDTIARFRFKPVLTTEYMYYIVKSLLRTDYYYGWDATNFNDLINITDEKYQTSSLDILKHKVCFIPTIPHYQTTNYDSVTKRYSDVNATLVNRIIEVTQYRINNETYQFFKDVNSLLSAQGKLFDPIAYQFKGNIYCKTNPQNLALGLFEASSIRTSFFCIKPLQKKVTQIPGFNPPTPSGCIGKIQSADPFSSADPPDWWIY